MPQWAGSCWYYLRSPIRTTTSDLWAKRPNITGWAAINLAGVDFTSEELMHAVLHLLYARFWQKVLFDLGYVSKPEPFQRLVNQGVNPRPRTTRKCRKSRGNIRNPDDVIDQHGADAFRCYECLWDRLSK